MIAIAFKDDKIYIVAKEDIGADTIVKIIGSIKETLKKYNYLASEFQFIVTNNIEAITNVDYLISFERTKIKLSKIKDVDDEKLKHFLFMYTYSLYEIIKILKIKNPKIVVSKNFFSSGILKNLGRRCWKMLKYVGRLLVIISFKLLKKRN